MSFKDTIKVVTEEAIKATPAGTTLTLTLFGIPITQWAAIISILVLLLQAYFLIRNNLGGKNGKSDSERADSGIRRSSGPDGGV